MLAVNAGHAMGFPLYSSSFMGGKSVKLRTSFKSNATNFGLGEVEALLFRQKGINFVAGYKNKGLTRPIGPPFFIEDNFRLKAGVWTLAGDSKVPENLVAVNTEPGLWVFSPLEDMELDKYRKLLERCPWTVIAREKRKDTAPKELPQVERTGLALLDQLIIQSFDNFIEDASRQTGATDFKEEVNHIENDICRVRNYIKNYREKVGDETNEVFIAAGTLAREKSHEISVLRPKSELFRTVILREINHLKKKSKRATDDKTDGKAKLFESQAKILMDFVGQFFSSPKSTGPTSPQVAAMI